MEVFDAISQHPIFSKAIKYLIYDSVQFDQGLDTDEDYFRALCVDLGSRQRGYMCSNTIIHDDFTDLTSLIRDSMAEPNMYLLYSELGLRRCQAHTAFVNGHEQYCHHHAEARSNFGSFSWAGRIVDGLKNLANIQSVTIRNSWDIIYDYDPDTYKGDQSDFVHAWTAKGGATIYNDGAFPVGSPLARSWSPAYLQPRSVESHNYHTGDGMLFKNLSDGIPELFGLLELVDRAGKLPHVRRFQVLGDSDSLGGISPYAFHVGGQSRVDFYHLARNLRGLQLHFTPCTFEPDRQPMLNLHRLKKFLETAYSLEWMSLQLPHTDEDFEAREEESLYHFALVIPQNSAWCLPNLQALRLDGLRTSYSDFVRLLFLNLPKLQFLGLSYFQLTDGHWEDIIEGLCKIPNFKACDFDNRALLCPSGDDLFNACADTEERWEDGEYMFLDMVYDYISDGGRHPCLARDAPDSASSQYMLRLDETLRELRTANL
ncbi:MAG: hypothetical protein Q9186_004620 [Xanthomendoza sp. 1 TL-2023]